VDNDEQVEKMLFEFESEDGDWTIRIVIREGVIKVIEYRDNDGIELDYENALCAFVAALNNPIAFQFMNDQGAEGFAQYLRQRKAILN